MKLKSVLFAVCTFAAGLAVGFALRGVAVPQKPGKTSFVERREGGYRFINPLLECDIADDALRNRELLPFKDKLEDLVRSELDKGWASTISVYFRELNDGLWFSIGDMQKFTPASLRKVPLMISLLKEAETGKGQGFLDRVVKFDLSQDYNLAQNIKPSQTMIPGRGYTVRDLIYRMIVYSDNNAFMLLTKIADPNALDAVYLTLRMQNPRSTQDDYFLSVQTYASFFRVLYNATYLGKEASEWALDILSQSEYGAGLTAGLPASIPVAHKFGEHSNPEKGEVQLHDCGIVYYPQHPYMLCVMSRGNRFDNLDQVIADVSRLTFSEIHAQHTRN